jgi:hypothetical protein
MTNGDVVSSALKGKSSAYGNINPDTRKEAFIYTRLVRDVNCFIELVSLRLYFWATIVVFFGRIDSEIKDQLRL